MQEIISECPPLQGRLRSLAEEFLRVISELENVHLPDASDPEVASKARSRTRQTHPPLPSPRVIREIIRHRRLRSVFFGDDWFADPAWDMLLDLAAARSEDKRVSVSSLCHASGVPPTTALRWINHLVESGLLVKIDDPIDGRRAFLELSDDALRKLARYFEEIGTGSKTLV